MRLRYQHRDRHGLLDLDDRLEHQRLERQILVHLLDVGYRIQHRLDEVSDDDHAIRYSLTKGRPLDMKDYWTRISLTELSAGTCRIDWRSEFEPHDGVDPEWIAENLRGAYEDMSIRLAAYANNR